jgi:phosphohistidine phosphatase
MELILWRHADAEDAAPGKPDAERSLTAKGIKQARRVAAWLKKRLPAEARVLVSPARRAQQTAQALSKRFETVREVGATADAQSVLKAAGWPDGHGTVVVVGHQPTLGQTVALLLTGRSGDWSIRKGAIWWLAGRARGGDEEVIVRAAIAPDLV